MDTQNISNMLVLKKYCTKTFNLDTVQSQALNEKAQNRKVYNNQSTQQLRQEHFR